jgi:hypothetical protein
MVSVVSGLRSVCFAVLRMAINVPTQSPPPRAKIAVFIGKGGMKRYRVSVRFVRKGFRIGSVKTPSLE